MAKRKIVTSVSPRVVRRSKSEEVSYNTARNYKDASTHEVSSRLAAVLTVIEEIDSEINRLTSQTKELRSRISMKRAEAHGLMNIVDSRQ